MNRTPVIISAAVFALAGTNASCESNTDKMKEKTGTYTQKVRKDSKEALAKVRDLFNYDVSMDDLNNSHAFATLVGKTVMSSDGHEVGRVSSIHWNDGGYTVFVISSKGTLPVLELGSIDRAVFGTSLSFNKDKLSLTMTKDKFKSLIEIKL